MANENAYRDGNQVTVLMAVDDTTGETVRVPTDEDGNLLIVATIADATVPDGGTGRTSFTAYAPIFGGTTSTSALQSGTVGSTGEVLTSNGAGMLPTFQPAAAAGGTVTDVSVVTANGVSGSVATSTTTPAITLTLGAITPSSVNGNTITTGTGTLTLGAGKTLTANSTLTLAGTDSKTLTVNNTMTFSAADDTGVYTFPTGTKTLVATDVATLSSLTSIGTVTSGTWDATTIAVTAGGTGVESFTDGGVVIGNGTGALAVTTAGTSGQVLTSNGAGVDPTFQTAAGGTGRWSIDLINNNVSNIDTAPVTDLPSYICTADAMGEKSAKYAGTNATSANWTIFDKNPRFITTAQYSAGSATGTGQVWLGFDFDIPTQTQTRKSAVFLIDTVAGTSTIYAVSSDGVTNQNNTVTGVTVTDINIWEIKVTATAALFYVNGVLKATNSTKWPAGAPTNEGWATYGVKNDAGDATTRSVRIGYPSVSMDMAT